MAFEFVLVGVGERNWRWTSAAGLPSSSPELTLGGLLGSGAANGANAAPPVGLSGRGGARRDRAPRGDAARSTGSLYKYPGTLPLRLLPYTAAALDETSLAVELFLLCPGTKDDAGLAGVRQVMLDGVEGREEPANGDFGRRRSPRIDE